MVIDEHTDGGNEAGNENSDGDEAGDENMAGDENTCANDGVGDDEGGGGNTAEAGRYDGAMKKIGGGDRAMEDCAGHGDNGNMNDQPS